MENQLQIGQWITLGYKKGYWQILEERECYNKLGKQLINHYVLKQGFTEEMKPRVSFTFEPITWCEPLPEEIVGQIEQFFADNPKALKKFENATVSIPAKKYEQNFQMPLALADELWEKLQTLPPRFTTAQLREITKDYKAYCCGWLSGNVKVEYKFDPSEFGEDHRNIYIDVKMKKNEKAFDGVLHEGDWVTAYDPGYWRIEKLVPYIATKDYDHNLGECYYQKGDVIGQWAVIKRAFNDKMVPKIKCDMGMAFFCKPVSAEVKSQIDEFYQNNPAEWDKFVNAPLELQPPCTDVNMDIPDEKLPELEAVVNSLPEKTTLPQFREALGDLAQYICKEVWSGKYIVRFPWEIFDYSEDYDQILDHPKIIKLK